MKNSKHLIHEVFTPTKPARLTFVERESINDKLVNAIRTPGKQLIVYGHSGSGKSTLLVNKLHQLYENHITTRCMKGITFEQIILDAFDQLSPYYIDVEKTNKTTGIGASIKGDFIFIKNQVTASLSESISKTKKRVLPPQLTPQALGRFVGEAKCCWVIEDFHKVDEEYRNELSQIMKVFMDMADDYSSLKIIAIGAVDTARLVVKYDSEMQNRVSEIMVPLMGEAELKLILDKGEGLLNIKLEDDVKNLIVHYSNGIAAVCHSIALNICIAADINETLPDAIEINTDILQKALEIYIEESSDTLKEKFDKALKLIKQTKYDNYRIVVNALSKFTQDGATKQELFDKILKDFKEYPLSNLTYCLEDLQKEARSTLVKYDDASGKYSFFDPIYRVYALVYFKNVKIKQGTTKVTHIDTKDMMLTLFKELAELSKRL